MPPLTGRLFLWPFAGFRGLQSRRRTGAVAPLLSVQVPNPLSLVTPGPAKPIDIETSPAWLMLGTVNLSNV